MKHVVRMRKLGIPLKLGIKDILHDNETKETTGTEFSPLLLWQ